MSWVSVALEQVFCESEAGKGPEYLQSEGIEVRLWKKERDIVEQYQLTDRPSTWRFSRDTKWSALQGFASWLSVAKCRFANFTTLLFYFEFSNQQPTCKATKHLPQEGGKSK